MADYWSRRLRSRLSRRRAILGTAGGVLAASFLAACGGDDSQDGTDQPGQPDTTGVQGVPGRTGGAPARTGSAGTAGGPVDLLSVPEDTTHMARRGGTYRVSAMADIPSFDPHVLSFANAYQVLLNYNRLFRVQPGLLDRGSGVIEGDLADGWEFSPDRESLTVRLRPDAGMPDVKPANGRRLNALDVTYSWDRWRANGGGRSGLVNDANPDAPILSLEATDLWTVVIRMKQPMSSILSGLANQTGGSFFILPVEAEATDPATTPIGGGPYFRSDYEAATRIAFQRNENHYEADRLFPGAIDMPIITDVSTGIAELKAGELHHYSVPAQHLLTTKRDLPEINLYQADLANVAVDQFFGFQPGEGTPFRDVRLRQAWSMMMDRDLYIDTFSNRARFEAQGVPVETAWNSALLSTAYRGWWLDPRGSGFGPTARYYVHDIGEATALAAAAGYEGRAAVEAHMIAGTEYGPAYHRNTEALQGMAGDPDGPFKLDVRTHSYSSDWSEGFRDSRGYFNGVAYRLTPFPLDPGEMLYAVYNTGGALYYGFDDVGRGTPPGEAFTGDPVAQELTAAMRGEFDDARRMELAWELQQYLAEKQYFITQLGSATGFELAWPYVKNWLVYQTPDHARRLSSYWFDPALPPGT